MNITKNNIKEYLALRPKKQGQAWLATTITHDPSHLVIVNQSQISQIANHKQDVTLPVARAISKALKRPLNKVFPKVEL